VINEEQVNDGVVEDEDLSEKERVSRVSLSLTTRWAARTHICSSSEPQTTS